MPSLEQRLTALEFESPAHLGVIILRGVVPGMRDAELQRLSDGWGATCTRQLGETEDEFVDRALASLPASPGVRLLSGYCYTDRQ
jgi:hypothetical protein